MSKISVYALAVNVREMIATERCTAGVYTEIVGDMSDETLHGAIHRLMLDDAVETVQLSARDLARRRLRCISDRGRSIAIALSRNQRLHDGAVLEICETHALIVRVEAEAWLRLRPADGAAALALGYHAGNMHWRVRFDGPDLLVAIDADAESYLNRLAGLLEDGRVDIVEQCGEGPPAPSGPDAAVRDGHA